MLAYARKVGYESTKHMKREYLAGQTAKRGRDAEAAGVEEEAPVWEPSKVGTADASLAETAFHPFAFVIGGVSRGDVDVDYCGAKSGGESVALGDRGLSAAATVSLLCHAFEEVWVNEWAQQ